MAEAAPLVARLHDMLECCICAEEFKDPRMLPCIHTFCLNCLEELGKTKQPGEKLPCPVCRTEFKIPDTGVRGVQKNFFMQTLSDMHRLSIADLTTTLCDACVEDESMNEKPSARVMCIECDQKLCEQCVQMHKKVKATKLHQLVDLKNKEVITRLKKSVATNFCDMHDNEPIKMYCSDCKAVICVICHVESHHRHKCSGVGKVGEDFQSQLKGKIKKISACLIQGNKEVGRLDEENRLLLNNVAKLQDDVLKRASRIKEIVDQHANKLILEIKEVKTKRQKEIENRKEEVSRLLVMLESYERYVTRMKEDGSAVDICRNIHELIARSNELEQSCKFMSESDSLNVESDVFTPFEFNSFLGTSNENVIGKITWFDAVKDPQCIPTLIRSQGMAGNKYYSFVEFVSHEKALLVGLMLSYDKLPESIKSMQCEVLTWNLSRWNMFGIFGDSKERVDSMTTALQQICRGTEEEEITALIPTQPIGSERNRDRLQKFLVESQLVVVLGSDDGKLKFKSLVGSFLLEALQALQENLIVKTIDIDYNFNTKIFLGGKQLSIWFNPQKEKYESQYMVRINFNITETKMIVRGLSEDVNKVVNEVLKIKVSTYSNPEIRIFT